MRIILEVPDTFNAMGVTIIYGAFTGMDSCRMLTRSIGREDVIHEQVYKIDIDADERG